jgi:PmbA protein
MRDELLTRAIAAVKLATGQGADGAWATTYASRSTECQMRDGKLETMQQNNSRGLSLELYVDGRYFVHSTNDLRDAQLADFVREAVALTAALEVDKFRALPDPALFAGRTTAALQIDDPAIAELDVDARIARCAAVCERITGKPGVISASSSFSDGRSHMAAASSNGFEGEYGGTFAAMSASATLRDKGDLRPEAGMGTVARHLADLPESAWVGDEALRLANARLGSKKGPTIKTTMVVDRLAADQLVSMLLAPARGGAVQQGRSFWAARRGKPVLSKRLEIVDDPHLPRGLSSRPFDGEGIATKRRTVVKGGALQTLFVDTYYGHKLGEAPTTGGWSNLVVTPGEGDAASIARAMGKGVYVTSWLGGNADDTTGDFSLGLRGHLIEGGKIGAPVGEMNSTGNLVDLFAHLVAVGADTWQYGGMRVPTLAFEKVSFSGA